MAEQNEQKKQIPNLNDFHPKIKQLFKNKESKLRMIDDWVLMETLGMGGYSKVKLGLHKKSGQKAALKIMFADQSGKMSDSKKKQLLRELNVMKKVNHKNVIKLITFNANAQYPEANGKYTQCIMTALEFASGGELFDYLMYTGCFDDVATRSYFKQLIDGLDAMHKAGIAHRDLKPENLLMDSSFTLKIADFGFATEFIDDKSGQKKLMKTACGTKNYLAPEFWKGLKYSYKCDLFAAGIILFTTYAGFPPFMEAQPNDWWWDKYSIAVEKLKRAHQLKKIIKKKKQLDQKNNASEPSYVSEQKEMDSCLHDATKRMSLFWKAHQKKKKFEDDDFKAIALNLIHPNPDERMDIDQIRKDRWFKKGPLYSSDELKIYLTKRVKTVLQGRARKIRKLMQEQQLKRVKYKVRGELDKAENAENVVELTPLQKRAKELDPKNLFIENLNHVKDDIFTNTLFQFWTYVPPAEMAARIEMAAIKFGNQINISAEENLITISCDLQSNRLMAGDKKESKKENVRFAVKQFLIEDPYHTKNNDDKKDDKKDLEKRYDVRYIVSFKRLVGDFNAYSKVADKYYNFPEVGQAMTWEDVEGADDADDADNNKNDDNKTDNE